MNVSSASLSSTLTSAVQRSAPPPPQPQGVGKPDADGDHDGSKASAAGGRALDVTA